MEVFGVTVSLWNIIAALGTIMIVSTLIDWFRMLAWRYRYKIKGPFPLPFIGTFYTASSSMAVSERNNRKKYGSVCGGIMGNLKGLHVSDVELLKKIFIKEHLQFQNRFNLAGLDPSPLDVTLLSLKDEDWKRVRNIVTPTFSPGKIKLMANEINFCADLLVQSFIEKASSEPVDVKRHFGCYSMDVIAGTAFGFRTKAYSNPDQPFVYHADKVFNQSVLNNPIVLFAFFFPNFSVILNKWFGVSFFYPLKSIAFFSEIIDTVMKERKENKQTERPDMMGLLMHAYQNDEEMNESKKLSREEVMAMGFIAFVAGYDTTASHLSFLAYCLATHPDIQDKVIEEIDAKFQSEEVNVKYEDIQDLPYLDQVVCEALRMYPPIPRMNRTTSLNKNVFLDGHWFPGNTTIGYSIWELHHELGLYEEPDKFIPERFSPEQKQMRDSIAFIPFGHGPRNCIGMRLALLESKIAVVHMLKKIKFVRCEQTQEPLELLQETFLRPKKPIMVGVEKRTANKCLKTRFMTNIHSLGPWGWTSHKLL